MYCVHNKMYTSWTVNVNVICERTTTLQVSENFLLPNGKVQSTQQVTKRMIYKAYEQWCVCYFYATIYIQCGIEDAHRMDRKNSWAQLTYPLTIMIIRRVHSYHFVSRTISLTSSSTKHSFPNRVNPTVACKKTYFHLKSF